MIKKELTLFMITISMLSYSQVGINMVNPQGALHIDAAKDNPAVGTPTTTQQSNDIIASAEGNIGIGTISPTAKLQIVGTTTAPPIKAINMETSYLATNANSRTLVPIAIDNDGVITKQFSPVTLPTSYALDGAFTAAAGENASLFTNINTGTIVTFEFNTNYTFGYSNTSIVYGKITFTIKNGFQVGSDWNYSGNSSSGTASVTGTGTNTLTFDYASGSDLVFEYSNGIITARKTGTGSDLILYVYNGKKIR